MVLAIVLIGAILRFQVALKTEVIDPIRNDARDYVSYAYNLVAHKTYSRITDANLRQETEAPSPDALRRPGYPIFLSLLLDPADGIESFIDRIKTVQALLSVISLLIVFQIAKSLLGYPYALGVLSITALSPHLINMNAYLLSESLFTLVQLILFWGITRWRESMPWHSFILAGMLLATAALIRAWVQYFVVLLVVWMLFSNEIKLRKKHVILVTLGFVVLFSIWTIRNVSTLGITSDNTLMINGLHHGMYPDFMYEGDPESHGFAYRADPRSEEINDSVSSILAEIYHRFQTDFWRHFRWYALDKTRTVLAWANIQGVDEIFVYPITHTPYYQYGLFYGTRIAMKAIHAPLMLLAVAGCLLVWAPSKWLRIDPRHLFCLRLLSLYCGYFFAVHIVTAPFPRYAIPLKPVFYLMAASALKTSFDIYAFRKNRRDSNPVIPTHSPSP